MTTRAILGDRPPSYVSKSTLAAELDISETSVDDYVRRGLLPRPIQIGGSVRWCWAQVQASLGSMPGAGLVAEGDPFMAGVKNVSSAA